MNKNNESCQGYDRQFNTVHFVHVWYAKDGWGCKKRTTAYEQVSGQTSFERRNQDLILSKEILMTSYILRWWKKYEIKNILTLPAHIRREMYSEQDYQV